MKKILLTIGFVFALSGYAENWDEIMQSEEYYYGVGMAATQDDADKMAFENLMNNIVVHVQHDFTRIDDETIINGSIDSKTKVMNCVKTYSQGTLRNVRFLKKGKAPNIEVLRYIKRSELAQVFEKRIEAARNFVRIADEAIEKRKVDLALQYYYWAYAMVRSLQYPYDAKDDQGRVMVTELRQIIEEILGKIDVKFESQDGEFVNLLFTYEGKPLSCIDFSYNDGQAENEGCRAQDGRGCIEMASGYENKQVIDVSIEFEHKSQSRGDAEMNSILAVIPRSVFKVANHDVKCDRKNTPAASTSTNIQKAVDEPLKPSTSQMPDNLDTYATSMKRIVDAIGKGQYRTVADLFDIEGLDVYNRIMNYGTPRLVGEQNLSFFKGPDGTVTARGIQMSFSFNGAKRATFVEDLVFTFNKEGKICNVAFGLGKVAENDILCRNVDWGDEVKESIMEFMENYKTAYCLKRHDYIRDIFADDAVIIVGKVTHRSGTTTDIGEHKVTKYGRDIITHNRYTKTQYLDNLRRCFDNPRNKYINVKFADNDVQTLNAFDGHKVFGIQIKQMYNSATYADEGYLFLMVDMTEPEKPQIKIRTWQPTQTPIEELYSAGDFYK